MAKKSHRSPKPEITDVVPSAAPGTEAPEAEKPPKLEKSVYPIPEGGLEKMPDDFDPKLHKPIKRTDFKDETVWFELKAVEHDKKAVSYRAQAKMYSKLGSIKDRAKAKRLIQMQGRIAELKDELEKQGIDVDAILN